MPGIKDKPLAPALERFNGADMNEDAYMHPNPLGLAWPGPNRIDALGASLWL